MNRNRNLIIVMILLVMSATALAATNVNIIFRRGSTTDWTTANPVLQNGEPGYEYDAGGNMVGVKVGNGRTGWNGLGYMASSAFANNTGARKAAQDNIIGNTYMLGSPGFSNLSTAKVTLNGAKATVYVPQNTTTHTLTIPHNMEVVRINGAIITVASGILHFDREPSLGLSQSFDGAGTVTGLKECRMEYFGGGNNIDSSVALPKCAAAAPVLITDPSSTYLLDAVSLTTPLKVIGGGTLKHKNSATTHMISTTAALDIEGVTLDGNRTNQTGRYYLFHVTSAPFRLQNVTSKSTVAGTYWISSPNGRVIIDHNLFYDMSEYGANAGDTSLVGYINGTSDEKRISVTHNDVIGNTPSDYSKAPAGFEFFTQYGHEIGVEASHNYFSKIGQSADGNTIGALDFYGQVRLIAESNRLDDLTYSAIKIKNCIDPIIANNVVRGYYGNHNGSAFIYSGYDTAAGTPLQDSYGAEFLNNIVDNWPSNGYFIVGQAGHEADMVKISGGHVKGAKSAIYLNGTKDINIRGVDISGSTGTTSDTAGIAINNSVGVTTISDTMIRGGASFGVVAQTGVTSATIDLNNVTLLANTGNHIYSRIGGRLSLTESRLIGTNPPINMANTAEGYFKNNISDYDPSLSATLLREFGNSWNPSITSASAMPTTGYHRAGDIVFRKPQAAGQPIGWGALTTGTNNVLDTDWKAMPNL